jgi:hypothetical protein
MGFFGSFFGSDQRKDLRHANKKATAALEEGYDSAYGDYSGAVESFQPYADQGRQFQDIYADALGLNGPEAQQRANELISSNPAFQGGVATDSNAMARALNARGQLGGGKAQLANARVLQSNYGNVLDRYRDGGAQGLTATNAMAAARQGRGDLSYGYGATKAGQAINMGNAMAESRGIGINNLLSVGELAVKALKPGGSMPMPGGG